VPVITSKATIVRANRSRDFNRVMQSSEEVSKPF